MWWTQLKACRDWRCCSRALWNELLFCPEYWQDFLSRNIWLVAIHIHQESLCNRVISVFPLQETPGGEGGGSGHSLLHGSAAVVEGSQDPGVFCCVSQTLHSSPTAKASTAKLGKGKDYGCREKKYNSEMEFPQMYALNGNRALLGRNMVENMENWTALSTDNCNAIPNYPAAFLLESFHSYLQRQLYLKSKTNPNLHH